MVIKHHNKNICITNNLDDFNKNISNITEINKKINNIAGWFSNSDQYIFDFLLNMQNQLNINGNLLEIGIWERKSLFKILNYCKPNETMFGLDNVVKYKEIHTHYNDFKNIEQLNLIQDNSYNIKNYKEINNIRFCHIDGDHTGTVAYNDIINANNYTKDDTILVLDDFQPYFIGVMQAYYKAYFTKKTKFVPFIMSNQKLYLCTLAYYQTYYNYTKNNIISFINNFNETCDIKFIFNTTNNNITNTIMVSQKPIDSIKFTDGYGRYLIHSFKN